MLDNDAESVRAVICEVASLRLDDGVVFDVGGAAAAVIRDEVLLGGEVVVQGHPLVMVHAEKRS